MCLQVSILFDQFFSMFVIKWGLKLHMNKFFYHATRTTPNSVFLTFFHAQIGKMFIPLSHTNPKTNTPNKKMQKTPSLSCILLTLSVYLCCFTCSVSSSWKTNLSACLQMAELRIILIHTHTHSLRAYLFFLFFFVSSLKHFPLTL